MSQLSKMTAIVSAERMPHVRPWIKCLVTTSLLLLCLGNKNALGRQLPPKRGTRLIGEVVDLNDARVPGARVIISRGTRIPDTVTDMNGLFSVFVSPGKYSVTVIANGFKPQIQKHIKVLKNRTVAITIKLSVKPVGAIQCAPRAICL